MTSQTQREANAAARVLEQHIAIVGKGTVRTTGQQYFIVTGSRAGTWYHVTVHQDSLSCDCGAGRYNQPCKHRQAVAFRLTEQVAKHTQAAQAARRIRTGLADDNRPISIWK